MKKILFGLSFLGAITASAQNAAPTPAAATSAPAASSPAPAQATRPKPDTHGLDMRTQSGPPETASARGYSPPVPVDPALPTLWVIGDSTVRNGSPGNGATSGQWGWGAPLTFYFDAKKINVVNRALGGTSSHSFYEANWPSMAALIKKGDFVLMQFGANDSSSASFPGFDDDLHPVQGRNGGAGQSIHSFGWYMKQYVKETRDKGATPIICSLTPRVAWTADGHFKRDNTTHVAWAAEVAKETNTPFIDLYELIARKSEEVGQEKTASFYAPAGEHLHTGWDGATVNAERVISGLKALKDDPLAPYFSDKAKAIAAVDTSQPAPSPAAATPAAATAK